MAELGGGDLHARDGADALPADARSTYKLQVTSYKLPATSYKLQVTSCKLQSDGAQAAAQAENLKLRELVHLLQAQLG